MSYQDFKNSVMGQTIGSGECVDLIVNNSRAYVEYLFPGVSWPSIIAPVGGAREMAGRGNEYLQWIANDPNDANQVPLQGDIMVFDATPKAGYTNAIDSLDTTWNTIMDTFKDGGANEVDRAVDAAPKLEADKAELKRLMAEAE